MLQGIVPNDSEAPGDRAARVEILLEECLEPHAKQGLRGPELFHGARPALGFGHAQETATSRLFWRGKLVHICARGIHISGARQSPFLPHFFTRFTKIIHSLDSVNRLLQRHQSRSKVLMGLPARIRIGEGQAAVRRGSPRIQRGPRLKVARFFDHVARSRIAHQAEPHAP